MRSQEKTERLRKTKFIILTSPRDRRHGTTWENNRVVKRKKTCAGLRFRPEP